MSKKLTFTEALEEKAYICDTLRRMCYTLDDCYREITCNWGKTGETELHTNRNTGETEERDVWDYIPKDSLSETDEIKLHAIERIRQALETLV